MARGDADRMPDIPFRLMVASMVLQDRFFPYIDKRIQGFPLKAGLTVVDYGCGPGRYTVRFARLVGDRGKVYAVDVQELALEYLRRRAQEQGVNNIVPVLARGYRADIPDHVADRIFVLDMIHGVREPVSLLAELHRICRPDGILVIDDGHQPRRRTLRAIHESGLWAIDVESDDHLQCTPRPRL